MNEYGLIGRKKKILDERGTLIGEEEGKIRVYRDGRFARMLGSSKERGPVETKLTTAKGRIGKRHQEVSSWT